MHKAKNLLAFLLLNSLLLRGSKHNFWFVCEFPIFLSYNVKYSAVDYGPITGDYAHYYECLSGTTWTGGCGGRGTGWL